MIEVGEPHWRNPPPFFETRGDTLVVRTGEKTDYWNRTFYGFKNGNGHLFAHRVQGDFSAVAEFAADYRNLYDQAGLMIHQQQNRIFGVEQDFRGGGGRHLCNLRSVACRERIRTRAATAIVRRYRPWTFEGDRRAQAQKNGGCATRGSWG